MSSYEPFVNHALMEKVLAIKERSFDNKLIQDEMIITKLFNTAINFTEDELIVCTIAALQVCPEKVYQALAYDREELLEKARKGKKNDGDSD